MIPQNNFQNRNSFGPQPVIKEFNHKNCSPILMKMSMKSLKEAKKYFEDRKEYYSGRGQTTIHETERLLFLDREIERRECLTGNR
jgi:glutaredoxin 2